MVLGVGEWGVGKDTRVERTQPLHWAGQRVWHTVGTEILFLHQSLASASREPGTLLQTAEQAKGRMQKIWWLAEDKERGEIGSC